MNRNLNILLDIIKNAFIIDYDSLLSECMNIGRYDKEFFDWLINKNFNEIMINLIKNKDIKSIKINDQTFYYSKDISDEEINLWVLEN